MSDYFIVQESQLLFYKNTPLYCQSKDKSYILYKKSGEILDQSRLDEANRPELFIHKKDKEAAVKELFSIFNKILAEQSLSKNLKTVRSTLSLIVKEALNNQEARALDSIPETIDILFNRYSEESELLEVMVKIKNTSNIVIEHTINVLLLTFRYCFFHHFSEDDTKRLALCALLHDIGASIIDRDLIEADHKLTDEEFEKYALHTSKGHGIIKKETRFDPSVAMVALEHHERIDGTGYPSGITDVSFDSQLIGLIDCYEPLTYQDKTYRKAKLPYDSLQLIKNEVMQGKFQTDLFKNLCSCLMG